MTEVVFRPSIVIIGRWLISRPKVGEYEVNMK